MKARSLKCEKFTNKNKRKLFHFFYRNSKALPLDKLSDFVNLLNFTRLQACSNKNKTKVSVRMFMFARNFFLILSKKLLELYRFVQTWKSLGWCLNQIKIWEVDSSGLWKNENSRENWNIAWVHFVRTLIHNKFSLIWV